MKIASILHYAKHPLKAVGKTYHQIYVACHPDEPWLARGAIAHLKELLHRDMKMLEYGSGPSTAWFAKRVGHLTSIEYQEGWYHEVLTQLQDAHLDNVDLRYIPLDHDIKAPTLPHYDPVPNYVSVAEEFDDRSFDFVVVDGHYRAACVIAAVGKIKPGGYILVDDTYRMPTEEWQVPSHWILLSKNANTGNETTIWQKPLS